MTIDEISKKARPIFAMYGVIGANIFGSVARGTDHPDSDIDLLIDLKEPIGVFRLVALKQELEECLGRSVDVVVREALDYRVASFIKPDLHPLVI